MDMDMGTCKLLICEEDAVELAPYEDLWGDIYHYYYCHEHAYLAKVEIGDIEEPVA